VLGQATPHFATYLPAAACVELAALIVSPRRNGAFIATAGLLVGSACRPTRRPGRRRPSPSIVWPPLPVARRSRSVTRLS
jgi:hypothetical protein